MTDEEKHLWFDYLRFLPITIKRQKVLGHYIADFYCASAKLVIELDGSQHREEKGAEADRIRDRYMAGLGLSVLRFTNEQVNTDFKWVCSTIKEKLKLN